MNFRSFTLALAAAFICNAPAKAQAPDPDPERFAASIAAFAAWDSKNSFAEDANLFVGSSSIRLWPTATAFPGIKTGLYLDQAEQAAME